MEFSEASLCKYVAFIIPTGTDFISNGWIEVAVDLLSTLACFKFKSAFPVRVHKTVHTYWRKLLTIGEMDENTLPKR